MAERGITLDELANNPQAVEALYQRLRSEGGGSAMGAMIQSDVNRGAQQGRPSDWSANMTPEQKAIVDRYAWGAQIAEDNPIAGRAALIPAAAYEGVKAIAPAVLETVGKVLPAGQEMKVDETTSRPSWDNVRALWAGYNRGR